MKTLGATLIGLLSATTLAGTAIAAVNTPNIVVILADDLGYGDLASYNAESKVPTPNLDRLAVSGMSFSQAYCPVSVCSPSRYSLLTGAYAWRSWKRNGVLGNWDRPMIADEQVTLPGMLQQSGYTTAGFGKWHLGARYPTTDGRPPLGQGKFKSPDSGANIDLSQPIEGGPVDRGFDVWRGVISSSEMLILDNDRATATLSLDSYQPLTIPGFAELPVINLEDYLPWVTDHTIDYLRTYDSPKPFFIYYAPYVPHVPVAVAPSFRGLTTGGDYGDYVHELDHEIGRLLASLDEKGLTENTLILFASDNGSQWKETGDGHRPNGALRGGKWSVYEGGVRTPLIVSWPGHVAANSSSDAIVSLTDVLATTAALVGAELPPEAGPDSANLLPLLLGQADGHGPRDEVLVQDDQGQFALRSGDWKYIKPRGKNDPALDELYNLSEDPAEANNRAAVEPERAASMRTRLLELIALPRTVTR